MPTIMKFDATLLIAALLVAAHGATASRVLQQATAAAEYDPTEPKNIKNQYIVMLKRSVAARDAPAARKAIADAHSLQMVFEYDEVFSGFTFSLPAAASATARDAVLNRLRQHTNVSVVQPDAEVTAFGTLAAGEAPDKGILRIGAINGTVTKNAAGVAVAVVDTGIALTHPDLNAVSGINCVSTKLGATAQDDNGHGTHCAGTIGAKNNGAGVVGVAPGTKLVAVKVLSSSGSGSWSSIICGLNWVAKNAAAQNIRVASLSLGGSGSVTGTCAATSDTLQQAICAVQARNVSVVVAAGNSNVNLATQVPAGYPSVLTVTAMADSDGRPGAAGGPLSCYSGQADDAAAGFSNWASSTDAAAQAHTIAAPGVCIRSTYLTTAGSYTVMSGTSMATPHVAGTVALCYNNGAAAGPCAGKTPEQVVQLMRNNAQAHSTAASDFFTGDPSKPITGRYYGYMNWAGSF